MARWQQQLEDLQRPLKIVCDLDGVLFHTTERVFEIAKERGYIEQHFTAEHVTTYLWKHCIPGLTDERQADILHGSEVYLTANGCEFLMDAMRQLFMAGHQIHFATARKGPDQVRQDTFTAMRSYGIQGTSFNFIDEQAKVAFCREIGADVLIEDRMETVIQATRECQNLIGLVVAAPYNHPVNMGIDPQSISRNIYRDDRQRLAGSLRWFARTRLDRHLEEIHNLHVRIAEDRETMDVQIIRRD